MPSEWKAAHVAGWFSLGTPWIGCAEGALQVLSGFSAFSEFGINFAPWVGTKELREASAQWPGIMALSPFPSALVSPTNPAERTAPGEQIALVSTPTQNYSFGNFRSALVDARRDESVPVFDQTAQHLYNA